MPAQSTAQRRFMGMVHAKQQGDLPDASSAVSNAADSMSDKSAEEFASTSEKDLPNRVRKEGTLGQIIGQYNEHGNKLRNTSSMREMAEDLMDLAEFAEQAVMSEADDWYDGHTIKRNMKELKNYVSEFGKIAAEYDTTRQRATALYDDIGRVLERYFELHSDNADLGDTSGYDDGEGDEIVAGNSKKSPMAGTSKMIQQPSEISGDAGETPNPAGGNDAEIEKAVAPEKSDAIDKNADLIARLLTLARHKLTGEQLSKFDVLPEEEQIKAAWFMLTK